jgi:carbamoyl-phosphate synthase small subunit
MNAAITTEIDKIDEINKKLKDFPIMDGLELASKVSTKNSYEYGDSNSKIRWISKNFLITSDTCIEANFTV